MSVSARSYQPQAPRVDEAPSSRPPDQTAEPFPTSVSVVLTPSGRQSRGVAGALPSVGSLYAATRRDGAAIHARGGSHPSGPAAVTPDPSLPRSRAAARPEDRPT